MILDFMRKSKTLMTQVNAYLPGNMCLLGLYVNRMDSCTRTGQDYMFRTLQYCDREYCTNYMTHRPWDIMVLFDYWLL
jgi:hypothetical protein